MRLRLSFFAALPLAAEPVSIEVERGERERFLGSFFHQSTLFLEGRVALVVYAPTGERALEATQWHFVPEANPSIDLLVDVVARQELLLIHPTTDAASLELVVQPSREGVVSMAVADEARAELNPAPRQRPHEGDESFVDARAPQDFGDLCFGQVDGVNADCRKPGLNDLIDAFGLRA